MTMKNLVVLTGAGISAESGIKTFRENKGLWEEYNVMDVATPQAWQKNAPLVQEFYNKRRKQVLEAQPNKAHELLVEVEKHFDVQIITQNIDDLHERAGSKKVLHLHGQITKARSTLDNSYVIDIDGWELKMGDKCPKGSQLRPHIVWFGEEVPNMDKAIMYTEKADILLIIGTSLQVYPAAGLATCVSADTPVFLIDPNDTGILPSSKLTVIKEKATNGMEKVLNILIEKYLK
jgi:NAD-dependent deacetylase